MASVWTSSTDFLFGDDFDAIFEALYEDEDFQHYLEAVVQEVQNEGVTCQFCTKICKCKQGLSRHIAAKHKDQDQAIKTKKKKETALENDVFAQLVKDTTQNIVQREVFHKCLKDEVKDYCLEFEKTTSEFRTVQNLYDSFISKGNSEAFYAKFYGEIVLNSSKYFKGLPQRAATLFWAMRKKN